MGLFDNPILNPFYQDKEDREPDRLAQEDKHDINSSTRASHDHAAKVDPQVNEDSASTEGSITSDYQDGLKKTEAVALVWSKWSLIGAYVGIFCMFFVISLQSQVFFNLTPYVYSDFALHKLVSVSSVMASIIGGVLRLPIGKMVDIWGRAEGFLVMLAVTIVGLIMMAACKNVATYAAAYVIYYTGYDGIYYVLQVFIADTSKLRNRGLMFAFAATPYIATAFAGPSLANKFLYGPGWHWGFGVFCIIYPVVALPLAAIFFYHQKKALRLGVLKKTPSNRTFAQSLKYYIIEFDVGGLLIVMAGLVLFLLPLNIAATETKGWHSPSIIAMIVIGLVLLIAFPFYEKFVAPKSFIPFGLIFDRTIAGAVLVIGSLFVSFYCWDLYFTSFLQVVFELSVTDAGYMANIYNIGSCFWGVIVGLLIRYTNRYKWLALLMLPVYILGAGLMIQFRRADSTINYVIMSQIFIAFGGGTLVICHEIAALAAGTHGTAAMILAIVALASQIGAAIGSTVAGAVWTNTFPQYLAEYLPAETKSNATTIYASLTTQLTYPVGDPTRTAINQAYSDSMRDMCIASVSITVVTFVGIWMWRDIRLNKKQVKGTVV